MNATERAVAHLGLHHVLPPYILERIAESGPAELREAALVDLSIDRQLRSARVAQPLARFGTAAEALDTTPNRTVFDAENRRSLPGTEVLREGGDPVPDVAVTEAYDGLGATFTFWWEVFGRNSIDANGLPLDATVHYGRDYDNAFWNGEQMVFGDGDGALFNRFTVSLDVIGHELAHGVIGAVRDLVYSHQSGALNESLADVFGSLVKQYSAEPRQSAEEADWLIGAGLLTSAVQGVALRSMKAPGTAFDDPNLGRDPQPASMADYLETDEDNGGVHINSGIPNRAFYLAAVGFGGYAWEKAGRIWFATLSSEELTTTATFSEFATISVARAEELFGAEGRAIVESAWAEVGVELAAAEDGPEGDANSSGASRIDLTGADNGGLTSSSTEAVQN
ncbi:M4 family metallopeptidase [Kineosporia rhizophila]|uniref:M4 family metallopeptidase n=1 Tax=Kineosporia TaxID=49184 RepID=UPI001E38AEA4|nr:MULTISPECIES: M4 family metallopeptidase [Kineosporia]MCE0537381.1 M4 family metallopeptidase [Kineosporia rhizophila]GLY17471.1 metalloprotease [Kineosporia sp. NBRC 101677]